MPQLETGTYFDTIIWTWIAIWIIYTSIAKIMIPNKYKIYEYRKEIIQP